MALRALGDVQVYVAYTEGVNFRKVLAGLLGLEGNASIGACLQRIRQLLDRQVLFFLPNGLDVFDLSSHKLLAACMYCERYLTAAVRHVLPAICH